MSQSNSPLPQSADTEHSSGNKPVDRFHDGPVHVSIWEKNGVNGAFRKASFQLRYRDQNQQWQTGYNYSASDLKHLETAAAEARARIEKWQQESKAAPEPRSAA